MMSMVIWWFLVLGTVGYAEEVPSEVEDVSGASPSIPDGKIASVYFSEDFNDLTRFNRKWIKSEMKKEGIDDDIAKYDGLWEVEQAERDPIKGDLGLVLKSKAKHSAISAKFDKPFVFTSKPLVVQYEVIHQNGQECGGAYLKLLSNDPGTKFHDKTPYTIMFGPDKCGNDYKLHFIFRHKNPKNATFTEKHCKKPKERLEEPFTDKSPHLYTLIVQPDNSFQILLDHKIVNEGNLLEDFTPPVNPPAEIEDPSDLKPADWDEKENIPDAEATKPEDWDEEAPQHIVDPNSVKPDGWLDNEPEFIPDPTAVKPSDWDDSIDGEWEAPLVDNPACTSAKGCGQWKPAEIINPAFKGKWRPPFIENPNYKGKWKPRRIPNPDYFEDKHPFKMSKILAIGFELWSMSNDILFDNIIITDEPQVAEYWASQTFDIKKKKMEKEAESLVTVFLNYSNEHPWLWAVYVVVVALPVVLVVFFCCSQSSQEKEASVSTDPKKTDAHQPDDDIDEEKENIKSDDYEEENEIPISPSQDIPAADSESHESSPDLDTEEPAESASAAGDAPSSPRKRRPRKD